MQIFLFLFTVVSAALGAAISRDGGTKPGLPKLMPLNDTSNLADYEVLFYEDPDFKGAGWGMVPIPNQPSSPDNAGQFCYFVEPGRVSSIKLVKQPNDRKFSCRFFRTTDACQHNKPALTLDYPAERAFLGPELDNQINSALCWWISSGEEANVAKHEVVELSLKTRQEERGNRTFAPHLVDVFAEPDFWGNYMWYMYSEMLVGHCKDLNYVDPPPWSSLRLNDFNTIYHCTFYDKTNCYEQDGVLYFDIETQHTNSVHDLRLTNDLTGRPWDNRIMSMRCKIGHWTPQDP